MLYVPIGYTFGAGMFQMDSIRGGSPYGAGVFAGDGSRRVHGHNSQEVRPEKLASQWSKPY